MDFHPLDVELFVDQEDQLLPTLGLLIDLFELLHVSWKEVQQFEMELYLLEDFLALAETAIDLAAHHQADIFFWIPRVELFDLEDDAFVAGPSLHSQHVGLIC